jgi:hypothetical protein
MTVNRIGIGNIPSVVVGLDHLATPIVDSRICPSDDIHKPGMVE